MFEVKIVNTFVHKHTCSVYSSCIMLGGWCGLVLHNRNVATLYLAQRGDSLLWACIEGMVGLSLPFIATTNGSYLAAWTRFGTSTLSSKRVYFSFMCLCFPILLSSMQNLIGWWSEGVEGHYLLFLLSEPTALIWLPGPDLALWLLTLFEHEHLHGAFTLLSCMFWCAPQFF